MKVSALAEAIFEQIEPPLPYREDYARRVAKLVATQVRNARPEGVDLKEFVRAVMRQAEDDFVEGRPLEESTVELPASVVYPLLRFLMEGR